MCERPFGRLFWCTNRSALYPRSLHAAVSRDVNNDTRAAGETMDAADPAIEDPSRAHAAPRPPPRTRPGIGIANTRSGVPAVCVRLFLLGSYTRDTWPNKAKTQLDDRPLQVHKDSLMGPSGLCGVGVRSNPSSVFGVRVCHTPNSSRVERRTGRV
jgi:hypothetical protein